MTFITVSLTLKWVIFSRTSTVIFRSAPPEMIPRGGASLWRNAARKFQIFIVKYLVIHESVVDIHIRIASNVQNSYLRVQKRSLIKWTYKIKVNGLLSVRSSKRGRSVQMSTILSQTVRSLASLGKTERSSEQILKAFDQSGRSFDKNYTCSVRLSPVTCFDRAV